MKLEGSGGVPVEHGGRKARGGRGGTNEKGPYVTGLKSACLKVELHTSYRLSVLKILV